MLDTLSVLFTDLVGSTELRARLGEDGADVVRRAHDELIGEVVAGHGGRVVKGLGDGFLATFGSAARAANAAVDIQQAFDRTPMDGADVHLSIRIGLSAGDVTLENDDVFGTPVIEAARLCAAADGGQILASSVVVALGGGRGGHAVTPHGDLALKGLPQPVSTVEIGWERADAGNGRIPLPGPLEVRQGTFPFCGRDDVVDAITTVWKQSRHSSVPACVLLAGEPGVGKTRLAAEQARSAHADGALVLFGRCDEDLGIAYQPFVEALRHHVAHVPPDQLGTLGAGAGDLARLDPQLPRRFPSVTLAPPTGDASVDQYQLFEAIAQWLSAAAGTDGLVLVLDDVHWATKPTLLALRHLLTAGASARLLVIATYRDTDLDRTHPLAELLADLRRVEGVERVALRGLDRAGIEQLMATTAEHPLDADGQALAAAVHAETEGNSFFVVEILRHLAESGALVFDGSRWVASAPVAQLAIPDGVREVVGRRLSRLSDDANEVLSWSAVIGREVRLDVLARVAGGELRCLDALDGAIDARLVDEVGPGRWRFSHALVASTLLAELRSTRRARMHLEVGEALEALAPDDVAALAQHFAEAAPLGVGDKAVSHLLAAGFVALEALDFGQAADLFDRAVEIVDDLGLDAPGARADALFGIAMARRWTGADYGGAADEAFAAAAALGDGVRMARALIETGRGYSTRTFEIDEAAVSRAERCLALLPDDAVRERALVTCQLIMELLFADDLPRLIELETEAAALVDRLGGAGADPDVLVFWLGVRTNLQLFPDHSSDLERLAVEIDRLAARAEGMTRRHCFLNLSGLSMRIGDRALALRALDEPTTGRGSLAPWVRAQLAAGRSGYEARYGSLDDAAFHADEVLAAMGDSGEVDAQLFWVNLMTFIRRQQGRHDEAHAIMGALIGEEYVGFLPPTARLAAGALVLVNLCEAERHDEAREIAGPFFEGMTHYPRDSVWLAVIGAFTLAAVELEAPCRAWLREQLATPASGWACWGSLGSVAPVATLRGRLAASLGDLESADHHLAEAVTHCREQRATWFLADALLYQGRARAEAGAPREQVTAPLREAVALAQAGGYATIERRARATLDDLDRDGAVDGTPGAP